jgi:hypothetical protein
LSFYVFANRRTVDNQQYQVDGYFTTSESTAEKLGIQEKAKSPDARILERRAHDRVAINAEGNTTSVRVNAGYQIKATSLRGAKTVTIRTFDKIAGSKARKPSKAYHQISFRFPGWCSTIDIADALGELIPEEKFAAVGGDGTQSQIEKFFRTRGGRRYPIMTGAKAEARGNDQTPTIETTGVVVAESQSEADALADKVKRTYYGVKNFLGGSQ